MLVSNTHTIIIIITSYITPTFQPKYIKPYKIKKIIMMLLFNYKVLMFALVSTLLIITLNTVLVTSLSEPNNNIKVDYYHHHHYVQHQKSRLLLSGVQLEARVENLGASFITKGKSLFNSAKKKHLRKVLRRVSTMKL